VFETGGFQVTQNLRHMLISKSFGDFQFHNEPTVHQQIGVVVADQGAVLVKNLDRMLRFDIQPRLAQPMRQRMLLHLLQMSVAMVNENLTGDLSNLLAQLLRVLHGFFFAFSALFAVDLLRRQRVVQSKRTSVSFKSREAPWEGMVTVCLADGGPFTVAALVVCGSGCYRSMHEHIDHSFA
jgi:hypothetical protein